MSFQLHRKVLCNRLSSYQSKNLSLNELFLTIETKLTYSFVHSIQLKILLCLIPCKKIDVNDDLHESTGPNERDIIYEEMHNYNRIVSKELPSQLSIESSLSEIYFI